MNPPPEIRTVYVERTEFALPDRRLLNPVTMVRPDGEITILTVQESLMGALGQCNGQLTALQVWADRLETHNKSLGSEQESDEEAVREKSK